MRIQREISDLSKKLKIKDFNLIGVIKILNKNNIVHLKLSKDEQVITGTDKDIITLCIVAGNVDVEQYKKNFSLTFLHIDKVTNRFGMSKDKFLASMEELAATGLQDHYIDDSGNMTIIQFHSKKPMSKQNQRRRKRGKVRRSNRRKKK